MGNAEPQAAASMLSARSVVELCETGEELMHIPGSDSDAGIADGKLNATVPSFVSLLLEMG